MVFKPGESGNPAGRKKGSKNRYTKVKHAIVEAFERSNAKDRFELLMRIGDDDQFFKCMDSIIKVLPKEPLVTNTTNIVKIDYGWSDQESTIEVCPPELSERDPQFKETE